MSERTRRADLAASDRQTERSGEHEKAGGLTHSVLRRVDGT